MASQKVCRLYVGAPGRAFPAGLVDLAGGGAAGDGRLASLPSAAAAAATAAFTRTRLKSPASHALVRLLQSTSPEMQNFLVQQQAKAQLQQTISRLTDECWAKCIGNPGTCGLLGSHSPSQSSRCA